jgi:hypothetical protein
VLWAGIAAAGVLLAAVPVWADGTSPPPPIPYLGPADQNGDLLLNAADFGLFVAAWTQAKAGGGVVQAADLNGDHKLTTADAAAFVAEWIGNASGVSSAAARASGAAGLWRSGATSSALPAEALALTLDARRGRDLGLLAPLVCGRPTPAGRVALTDGPAGTAGRRSPTVTVAAGSTR